ncbi:MAG: hypothetical protein A3K19_07700 [Lentisphaerae bacterium RIFOXYB12_FULL_65_16]|nr:MAG: hypothetical protein A3K19_07700 [Lentisphaerae bacterium RIFOXYB12_FULL_65_16]
MTRSRRVPACFMRGATRFSSATSAAKSLVIGRAQLAIWPPNPATVIFSFCSVPQTSAHSASVRSQTLLPLMARSSMLFQPAFCTTLICSASDFPASSANPV